ncbi:nicotinic acid mononucleotide adenylyltransferase [Fischerella thermalis CCMEE 5198]|jgi:nicotinate-nucleotide adenylyltransferase|uniref:nicotinate-nucleotide adenylyltransferase n=1 Tax=Fischerella thermalis TaxID=372787 RepID=UPI000C7FDA31|nr:nicotinate-nucleotide adenylyltransferase [Fischerella thermalis]PLZ89880.1 nicotinic acid mononucleotide adenylyltransferase [Fischerella thermalis CCMEE 5196]PMB19849.1 nicotinic acid mononucleotide adenylyltransferase [Fischerella thermalis CCMEE 5198]
MKIALFGTSADPPTAGHQAIIKWLSHNYDRVVIWAADNPFKSHQTPLQHRVAMLHLLIDEIHAPQHNISLEQELSSFRTLETLDKAKQRWGTETEFTLVIGSDLLPQLPHWYRIEDLLHQVQLLVVPRPGYVIDQSSLQTVENLGAKIAIAQLHAPDVSSTAYRNSGDPEALTPPVIDYIHQQHLYKCQDASKKSLQIR